MSILIWCMITAFVFSLIGFISGKRKQRWFENVGEAAVRRLLLDKFPGSDYHLMNNITLPFEDGTTQIDHVLVSRYGIFVIETKNYRGWLFGDENSQMWTQIIFKFRSRFYNPIHQNYKHVIAIKKLLDFVPKQQIHSLVVFTGDAIFKTGVPQGVTYYLDLPAVIRDYNEIVMSENRMQFCIGRIEAMRKIISKQTDVEHQDYLVNKHLNRYHK